MSALVKVRSVADIPVVNSIRRATAAPYTDTDDAVNADRRPFPGHRRLQCGPRRGFQGELSDPRRSTSNGDAASGRKVMQS